MTVTIKDLAKKAGCSITTVSRALNGYDDVNEDTRKRIFEVAKELNYSPNRVAQNLVTKKFKTIGMFVLERTTFFQPFVFEVISGLVDYATEKDYDLLLYGMQSLRGANPSQLGPQRGVGGAIIMGLRMDDEILQALHNDAFPTVLVDVPIVGKRATYVTSNNQLGSEQAITHLCELGHRNIGFINGHGEAWVSIERLRGYKSGLAKCALTCKEEYIFTGDFSKESGKLGARTLLKNNPEITAIYVASDLMATGAIEELMQMGYQVPRDISVMGFDDQEFASHVSPTLSTIRQAKYQIGVEAARQLIGMIEDGYYEPGPLFLETSPIFRESTGPVRDKED